MDDVKSWVLSYLDRAAAVLVGAIGTVVYESLTGGVSRLSQRIRIALRNRSTPPLDLQTLGLFVAGEWSPARRLTPRNLHQTSEAEPVPSNLISPKDWSWAKEQAANDTGDLVSLKAFTIDHRESERTQLCYVTLAPSDYSDVRAIEALRINRPHSLQSADRLLESGVRNYLLAAVPSSIAVNVVVLSENDELLCLRRSSAVDNGVGLWTVGIYETMKRPDPNNPGTIEDFFELTSRALKEELGLKSNDGSYHDPAIAWFGIYKPLLRGHLVAVTRARVPKSEIERALRSADSNYEHDNLCWLPLDGATVKAFCRVGLQAIEGQVGGSIRFESKVKGLRREQSTRLRNKNWIDQAPLSVLEAWKFAASIPR